MRTKTLLIAAAAALAAGIVSTQAQVYSQNIVGYVNTPAVSGTLLLDVPFVIGVSNGANEIWPLVSPGVPSIPDGSAILLWTGNGFNTYLSDSGSSSLWDDANGNPIAFSPKIPVGQGFFLQPAGAYTNTFVGTVAVSVGSTNSTSFGTGTYLVAPVVPYGGFVTNGTATGGGVALDAANGLPDGSALLLWNGNGFNTYLSDSGSSSFWDDANGNPITTPPSVNVGQGFFIQPAGSFTWTEGLSAQ